MPRRVGWDVSAFDGREKKKKENRMNECCPDLDGVYFFLFFFYLSLSLSFFFFLYFLPFCFSSDDRICQFSISFFLSFFAHLLRSDE
jgi:hypothetical protein